MQPYDESVCDIAEGLLTLLDGRVSCGSGASDGSVLLQQLSELSPENKRETLEFVIVDVERLNWDKVAPILMKYGRHIALIISDIFLIGFL